MKSKHFKGTTGGYNIGHRHLFLCSSSLLLSSELPGADSQFFVQDSFYMNTILFMTIHDSISLLYH